MYLFARDAVATQDLNLTAAGITLGPRGIITVGPGFQSPEASHIYAAGDVVGAPALASTSIEQARIAIHHAFGQPLSHGLGDLLPTGIYTIPEVSSVGETEQSLIARDIPYIVGRCRYSDTARGKIIGDGVGFVKLLFDRSDLRLLGVHLMGEHATDLIHVGLIAMAVNAKADLFEQLCFNYPTLGNLYKYATQDALLSLKQGGRCSPD